MVCQAHTGRLQSPLASSIPPGGWGWGETLWEREGDAAPDAATAFERRPTWRATPPRSDRDRSLGLTQKQGG